MSDRRRLPNRRYREGFTIAHRGVRYEVCIGRNVTTMGVDGPLQGDGGLRELFFSCTKAGTDVDADARDMALLFSLAVQYGAPIESIRAALTKGPDGKPAGLLGQALELIGDEA